jgi:tetratricopeptide (TPR) repeat protein
MGITQPERAFLARIKVALGKLLDEAAPTRAETLARAGIKRAAYNTSMHRGSLKVVWLHRILSQCDADVTEFFANALAEDQEVEEDPCPPELLIARQRVETEDASAVGAGPVELSDLETLAQERPAVAVARARELVKIVPLKQLPRVLAFCGTAYRFQEYYEKALLDLHQAQAWETCPILQADQNQRLAYVYGLLPNDGPEIACQRLADAQAEYLLQGLDSKVGETLIDLGMQLFYQGNKDKAAACLNRALAFLAADDPAVDFFTIHLGMALCGHDPEINLAKADELPVSDVHRAKSTWFKAKLEERNGNFNEAFNTFVSLTLSYLEIQQTLNACWAASEAARLLQVVQTGTTAELASVIGRITFILPSDSRAGAALARLWVGVQTPQDPRVEVKLLVTAVREAVKREQRAATRTHSPI